MLPNAEMLELERLREVTASACAALGVHAPRMIPSAIEALRADRAKLRTAATDVLAAWDRGTGLLTTHYHQAGRKLIEQLRAAAKT